ncbi:MAG: squalene/phytoene synthase family protein [Aliishimia sp.]
MGWSDELNACAGIVEKGDPARFRTVMAAPLAAREKLFPLYAFNVEVSRAPWLTVEPMIAEMRLQWWRDALEEIAQGGAVRRHEVVSPLADLLSVEMAQDLDQLVEGRRWDCYKDPFEDDAHLTTYLTQTSGVLMDTAAQLLGAAKGGTEQAGYALGVANWLRAIPALVEQKRIPLLDGTPEGVKRFAHSGLEACTQAHQARVSRDVVPALWPATGIERVLKAAISTPARVADGALPDTNRAIFALKAALGRW